MIAADRPVQRPREARLLVVDADGRDHARTRARDLVDVPAAGDLVVANDAATLPASLAGRTCRAARPIEVRLAGRRSLAPDDVAALPRRRVRRRRLPHAHRGPAAAAAARAPATGWRSGRSPRPSCALARPPAPGRAALRRHGRRDLGRPRAARPADPVRARRRAAGALGRVDADRRRRRSRSSRRRPASCSTGRLLARCARAASRFATLTHAAGLSSTGDAELDPAAVRRALPHSGSDRRARSMPRRARGGRVVAVGTTVVRALEHAARRRGGVRAGDGVATQRHRPQRPACASSMRSSPAPTKPGTSHHELLRAFVDDATLARIDAALEPRMATARTSSAIRSWSSAASRRSRLCGPRSNLNTATLARRLGQRRTALPVLNAEASRIARPSLRASTSKSA